MNYYISNSGNDSNSGISQATAWATLSKVNNSAFVAGDNVLFKRGDIWREQLIIPSSGTSSNPIIFEAYGAGNDPIISAFDLVTIFIKESTNVWKTTVNTQPTVVYFDANRGKLIGSTSCNNPYEWYWSNNTLYIYAPDDIDPTITYTSIEVAARDTCLTTNNKIFINVRYINFQGGNSIPEAMVEIGGWITGIVEGIIISNCKVEKGTQNAVRIRGGESAVSVIIDNCIIINNGNDGIAVYDEFIFGQISNSIISNNGLEGERNDWAASGIIGSLGNFDIYNNKVQNNQVITAGTGSDQSHGIYIKPTSTLVNIHDNIISGHLNGRGIKSMGSATIYRNEIYDNYIDGIGFLDNGNLDIVANIYSNIIYDNNILEGYSAGINIFNLDAGKVDVTIHNNTIYKNSKGNGREINMFDTKGNISIKNNIIWSVGNGVMFKIDAQSGTILSDYNLFWTESGLVNIIYDENYELQLDAWRGYGFDQNGININPDFIEPGVNFKIQSGSPAINIGVDVGLTSDYLGNPIVGLPDIGAYEYDSTQLKILTSGGKILKRGTKLLVRGS